jgi:hypothetical protein
MRNNGGLGNMEGNLHVSDSTILVKEVIHLTFLDIDRQIPDKNARHFPMACN